MAHSFTDYFFKRRGTDVYWPRNGRNIERTVRAAILAARGRLTDVPREVVQSKRMVFQIRGDRVTVEVASDSDWKAICLECFRALLGYTDTRVGPYPMKLSPRALAYDDEIEARVEYMARVGGRPYDKSRRCVLIKYGYPEKR